MERKIGRNSSGSEASMPANRFAALADDSDTASQEASELAESGRRPGAAAS